MPGGDGTGPAGMGPMTGRAAGYCAGYSVPGFVNPGPGGGFFGWGRGGGGWGRRNWLYATGLTGWQRGAYGFPAFGGVPYATQYWAPPTRQQEMDLLKEQAAYLEEALDSIRKRLNDLESATEAE